MICIVNYWGEPHCRWNFATPIDINCEIPAFLLWLMRMQVFMSVWTWESCLVLCCDHGPGDQLVSCWTFLRFECCLNENFIHENGVVRIKLSIVYRAFYSRNLKGKLSWKHKLVQLTISVDSPILTIMISCHQQYGVQICLVTTLKLITCNSHRLVFTPVYCR